MDIDGIAGAVFVVGLRIHVVEPANLYRIEADVQLKINGVQTYEQHVAHFATYAEVITWLGGLLSSAAATATVTTHLNTLRGA